MRRLLRQALLALRLFSFLRSVCTLLRRETSAASFPILTFFISILSPVLLTDLDLANNFIIPKHEIMGRFAQLIQFCPSTFSLHVDKLCRCLQSGPPVHEFRNALFDLHDILLSLRMQHPVVVQLSRP
jgi:hypothetical protein